MKKRTIFQNQSQEILKLFENAKDRSRVMCVSTDYAKKEHAAMLCNGNGKILHKQFPVKNSLEGKKYLVELVTRSCRHHGINTKYAFFGGEDCGSYADNFISALRSDNGLVAGVNACDAKKQRENLQASTERLDLLGISKMLLNCRKNCSPVQSAIYWNMRMLVRQRRKLVQLSTGVRLTVELKSSKIWLRILGRIQGVLLGAYLEYVPSGATKKTIQKTRHMGDFILTGSLKHRIHTIADRIFPGFLDRSKSGILPTKRQVSWPG